MDFCIFYGNFFQNWFPGFAHILHVEFLTVRDHNVSGSVGVRASGRNEALYRISGHSLAEA